MTWLVVIPFKGASRAKSRLAARFEPEARAALAVAMLRDTVSAVRDVPEVGGVIVVSSEPGLAQLLTAVGGVAPQRAQAPVEVLADPGAGLNAAIAEGIAEFRAGDDGAHVAALLGDLPALKAAELAAALRLALAHPLGFVPDAAGTGTTMITVAPAVAVEPLFGVGSAAAHAAAGFEPLAVPPESGLRRDVDDPDDLDALGRVGRFTRVALAAVAAR